MVKQVNHREYPSLHISILSTSLDDPLNYKVVEHSQQTAGVSLKFEIFRVECRGHPLIPKLQSG